MYDILLPFFVIIASGMLFKKIKPGGMDAERLRQGINALVFNVLLPALCIHVFTKSKISMETALIPLTAWLTLIIMGAVCLAVYAVGLKRFAIEKSTLGALILVSIMGNVTYLGLPVLTGLYGKEAARYALYYDLLATTPFLWLVGVQLGVRFGNHKKVNAGDMIKKLCSLPPIWGIAIGLGLSLFAVPVPSFLLKAFEMLGSAVIPLMTFSIGLSLSFVRSHHMLLLAPVIIFKLMISPFVSLGAGHALGLSGTPLYACFLEGGMPTMVLSLLFAEEFGLDVKFTALAIVTTTVCSFLTLPGLVHLTRFF